MKTNNVRKNTRSISFVLAGAVLVNLTLAQATPRWPDQQVDAQFKNLPLRSSLLEGGTSKSVVAASGNALLQGMNPEHVAGTIKANAQALKAFAWQQRMQL